MSLGAESPGCPAATPVAAIRQRLLARLPCQVASACVEVGGLRTHYLQAGGGDLALVLLHGGGGGAIGWAPVLPALAAGAAVVAPDLPGYGESDKPVAAYDAAFYTNWLEGLLARLGLARVALLGCSLGAAVAVRFALARPESVSHLVLGTPVNLTTAPLPPGMLLAMLAMHLVPCPWTVGLAGRYLLREQQVSHGPASREMLDYALAVLRQRGGRRPFLRGRGRVLRPLRAAETAALQPPTLVIWGRHDRLISDRARQAAAARHPHLAYTTLADAGHIVFADAPQPFAARVLGFLGRA